MSWYALASYATDAGEKIALVLGSDVAPQIVDLATAYRAVAESESSAAWPGPSLQSGLERLYTEPERIASLAQSATALLANGDLPVISNDPTSLCAPFRPPRIFAAASNYAEHAEEMGTVLARKENSNPYIFIKASTAVIGPGDPVVRPVQTEKLDWEVELAAVIGCKTRRVSIEDALDCVVGYTIVNDVSARDLTRRSDFPFKFDWFQGKSFDTFAPLGPWLVPRDVVGDPHALRLGLQVNDEQMQDGTTAEMIFDVREQISYLSHMLTLEPGDVIATGTPTGVGASRGVFLQPGDVMRASIERIGELQNAVVAEDQH